MSDQFAKQKGEITVKPWATVRGTIRIGANPSPAGLGDGHQPLRTRPAAAPGPDGDGDEDYDAMAPGTAERDRPRVYHDLRATTTRKAVSSSTTSRPARCRRPAGAAHPEHVRLQPGRDHHRQAGPDDRPHARRHGPPGRRQGRHPRRIWRARSASAAAGTARIMTKIAVNPPEMKAGRTIGRRWTMPREQKWLARLSSWTPEYRAYRTAIEKPA